MYSASKNIEIFMGSNTDEVIDRLFNIMLQKFQKAKEASFERGSEFIFQNVDSLYYYFQKIGINRSGSYIETPDWLKYKKVTVNPKNTNDDNCFQYSITAPLDHEDIGRNPHRISKIKPFISKYNWKDVNFPAGPHDWKKFEQNNKAIALNILYAPFNSKQIRRVYKSNYNNERENQVILLMISEHIDRIEKRHYLALKSESVQYNGKSCNLPVKSLSRLLNGISSNHVGDFYCLNCFNSYSSENKLKKHEEICNKHVICSLIMPNWDEKNFRIQSWRKIIKSSICNLS